MKIAVNILEFLLKFIFFNIEKMNFTLENNLKCIKKIIIYINWYLYL